MKSICALEPQRSIRRLHGKCLDSMCLKTRRKYIPSAAFSFNFDFRPASALNILKVKLLKGGG